MGKTNLQGMQEEMVKRLGEEQGTRVGKAMAQEYGCLCSDVSEYPKDFVRHLHNNIFPVVATFRVLQKEGRTREEAAKIANDAFLELMKQPRDMIQKMCKIPGVYRLMPFLWKKLMPKLFPESAGFRFRNYPTDSKRVKFDMTECPYYKACQKLDCLEVAETFCTTDDVCYSAMHANLFWNRTKTIARGGDFCDFDIIVRKPED